MAVNFCQISVEDVCYLRISIHDNFLPHFLSGHVPRLAISSPKRNVESSILSPDANLTTNIPRHRWTKTTRWWNNFDVDHPNNV